MWDDWRKLTGKGHTDRGLKVRHKLLIQGLIGAVLGAVALYGLASGVRCAGIAAAWGGTWAVPLGLLCVVWFALVVATMSNAVNVTDGLDGLAGGLTLIALVPLCLLPASLSDGAGAHPHELCVYCGALFGAVLGFLWHNWHPAHVFMGDTGSLAIGGSMGLVAVMAGVELLLPLIAFVFLAEFGSSVLQVLWFRTTGRRILPIAPLHHMFQRMGWPETHIVARFQIVGLVAASVAFIWL
jgi:phospho-N-acetylmuramoyl-pentapeptide-transferase